MVNRVLKYGLVAVVCALPALLGTTPANAISWGEKGSNGKVCRVLIGTHNHYGLSGLQSTKAAAKAAAVKRWSGFTVWEYGKAWGKISLAQRKSFSCRKARRGGWRCRFVAQACKS